MNPFHIIVNLIKWLYDQLHPHPKSKVEQILDYSFHKPSLLEEALTHSSFSNGSSYQRLEFVGDAALNLAMTKYLYSTHPGLEPDRLSPLRSENVSNKRLARVAVRHSIYSHVRRDDRQLDTQVEVFTNAVKDQINGGSTGSAPKVLADVVEAIAAAIYEDCNFNLDEMWKVVRKLLEPIIIDDTFYVPVEDRERRLPCCGIGIGWLLFILGFFLAAIPWYVGAIMLCFSRVDYREKPGYIRCTIAAVLVTIAVIIGARKEADDGIGFWTKSHLKSGLTV